MGRNDILGPPISKKIGNLLKASCIPRVESPVQDDHGLLVKFFSRIMESYGYTILVRCILDAAALILGFALGLGLQSYIFDYRVSLDYHFISLFSTYIILLFIILYLKSGYIPLMEKRPEDELAAIVMSMIYATSLFLTISYLLATNILPRMILLIWFPCSCLLLIIFRFGLRETLKKLWSYGLVRRNVVIIGDSIKSINTILEHLFIQGYKGFNVLGYVSDNLPDNPQDSRNNNPRYLGKFEDLLDLQKVIKIDKVVFAMRGFSFKRHQTLISRLNQCAAMNLPAMIPSQIFNNFDFSLTLNGYAGIFTVRGHKAAYSRPLYLLVKRVMDIFGSLAIMAISLPLWLAIIIVIKLYDGGPIFFRHRLVGKNKKFFHALKFRTMVSDAQEIIHKNPELFKQFEENYKLSNDPRVTRVGKWLRKYSLDELPQFINILKGEMSLVGPRPVREEELDRFGDFKEERTKICPGLTGFWQVNGRCNTTYTERILMDRFYLVKCNLWMDAVILLKTPLKVILGDGAM